MIEVFKTNVSSAGEAKVLAELIETTFDHYKVNFDLDDCDRIMRVKTSTDHILAPDIVKLLKAFGILAEVLPDEVLTGSAKNIPAASMHDLSMERNSFQ